MYNNSNYCAHVITYGVVRFHLLGMNVMCVVISILITR